MRSSMKPALNRDFFFLADADFVQKCISNHETNNLSSFSAIRALIASQSMFGK